MIDISQYDKADVLAALYNHARAQGFGYLQYSPAQMTREEADALLAGTPDKRFDYVQGRVLKVDLSGHDLETRLYDRDNGEGSAQEAIETIKAKR